MVKKILAIDGGGMYGVVAAQACIEIEKAMGGKKLKDIFDLFVGTSTGALICSTALMGDVPSSTEKGLAAEEIKKKYYQYKDIIFKKDPDSNRIFGANIDKPAYEGHGLKNSIREILGSRRMALMSRESELISVSAYNVSRGETRFFRSWRDEDKTIQLEDAVTASSSGPTKHPMFEINGDCYTDGGVFAENPSFFALGDAMELWPNEQYVIVSLGTGVKKFSHSCNEVRTKNDLWWARNLPSIFLDGQHESIEQTINKLGIKASWLKYFRFNIDLEGITDSEQKPIKRKKADELDVKVLKQAESKMATYLSGNAQFSTMIQVLSN